MPCIEDIIKRTCVDCHKLLSETPPGLVPKVDKKKVSDQSPEEKEFTDRLKGYTICDKSVIVDAHLMASQQVMESFSEGPISIRKSLTHFVDCIDTVMMNKDQELIDIEMETARAATAYMQDPDVSGGPAPQVQKRRHGEDRVYGSRG